MSAKCSTERLLSLQILRAVAALSVVYFHVAGGPKFGAFGVDLFFVLSGFVMAMLVAHGASPGVFMLRRMARIVPLYWLTTLAVVLVGAVQPAWLASAVRGVADVLHSLLFIPYSRDNGVLAPVLGVGWTLNYEMFFYALIAACLWVQARHATKWVVVTLLILFVIGLLAPASSVIASFFGSSHVLEFALGMACYRLFSGGWHAVLPLWLAGGGLVGAYALMAAAQAHGSTLPPVLLYGLPAMLMLLAALRFEPALQRVRLNMVVRGAVALGDASYAIYLVHFFVTEAVRIVLAPRLLGRAVTGWLEELAVIALATAIGYAVYVAVDRPLHRACDARVRRLLAVTPGDTPRRRS